MSIKLSSGFAAILLASASFLPTLAAAQEVEEVIVTATKRAENLKDVPISIAVVGRTELEQRGEVRLADLRASIPNFTVSGQGESLVYSPITIRGIQTSDVNIGFEGGIGVYVDGVLQGRTDAANQVLPDIERVELLRGPQGTLFGKNTVGGAINIVTIKPSDDPAGKVNVRFGNLGQIESSAYVVGPLEPGVLDAKISAFEVRRDGYVHNIASGHDLGSRNEFGGRAQLLYKPTDDVNVLLSLDASNANQSYFAFKLAGVEAAPTRAPAQVDFSVAQGYYNVNQTDDTARRRLFTASATIDWNVFDGYQLTSVTAFHDTQLSLDRDIDEEIIPLYYGHFKDRTSIYSQELRIASPKTDRFNYVAGLYFFEQDVYSDRYLDVDLSYYSAALGLRPPYSPVSDVARVATSSAAGFVNGNFEVIDGVTIFGGARYTYERKALTLSQGGNTVLGYPTIPTVYGSIVDHAATPMGGVSWAITPELTTYAKVAEGFKSGGWNAQYLTNATAAVRNAAGAIQRDAAGNVIYDPRVFSFKPESATSEEVGLKADVPEWHARANLALFHTDYSDQQISVYDPSIGGNRISNAGQSVINGLELETRWNPIEPLALHADAGYTEAHFESFPNCTSPYGVQLASCAGHRLTGAPRWTGSVGAQWTQDLRGYGSAFLGADVVYRSGVWAAIAQDNSNEYAPSFTVVNARAGWTSADGAYRVQLYADNLFDRQYVFERFVQSPLALSPFRNEVINVVAPPRTWGVQLTYKFGGSSAPEPMAQPASTTPPPPAKAVAPATSYLVFFDFDKSIVTPEAARIIANAAGVVKGGQAAQVSVTGHTDLSGSDAYNLALSKRRAQAVADQLIADGVPAREIVLSYKGKREPLVPTADGVREPQNRRAEIVLR